MKEISEVVSEVGVTITKQLRHLGPFTYPLSSSPSVDHDQSVPITHDVSRSASFDHRAKQYVSPLSPDMFWLHFMVIF